MRMKIAEFDLRNPNGIPLGLRGMMIRMVLESNLREKCGSTDVELESHEKLVGLCNDYRFAEGVEEVNNFFGKMSDEVRFELVLCEELYKLGVNSAMPLDIEVDTVEHYNISPTNGEELLYRQSISDELPFFGQDVRYMANCN